LAQHSECFRLTQYRPIMPSQHFFNMIKSGYLKPMPTGSLADFVTTQKQRHTGDDEDVYRCTECVSSFHANKLEFYWFPRKESFSQWCSPCMTEWRQVVNSSPADGVQTPQPHTTIPDTGGMVLVPRTSIPICPVCAFHHLPQCSIPTTPPFSNLLTSHRSGPYGQQ
jgi:hypothetical protein